MSEPDLEIRPFRPEDEDRVEPRLLALGCPKINLQVRAANADAVAFYAALGYIRDDVVCFGHRLIHDER